MLFEEAAGISKFKKRKKETLKKLEDTDADLERVEDLLFEIEKNMKSLEKQAKQTETYYRIKDEYKEKSITLAKVVVNQQKSRHDSIQKRIQDENDRKLELTSSTADKEASIEQAKADLIGKEKTLSSRQKSINEFVSRIRQYESDKQIKNERLKYLNDRISNLKEQIDQDKKSNERARFSIQSLESEKESAQLILTEITQKLDSLKAEYEEQKTVTASLQSEVDSLRQVQRTKQEESFQINKAVEIREIQINSFKQELERTASDTSQQSASLVEFEKKLVELQEEINKKNELLESLKREEEDTLGRISSMEKTIEMIREELTSISRKLDARQNEYNLTKSLVENLEGFPEAIKFLKKRIAKNAPLLSDILTCPEEYRVPIENYLESYLNYYIVDHESEAYEAINILSDASKGKANFFILDAFEKFDPTPTRIYDNAFPATQIIEFDPKYRKLMSFILDRVYIYEGGDIKGIPAEDDNIFITKSGKFTKRRFSLSGGSVGLFEGKRIGRAKNLEKLDKEIRELTGKLNTTRESLVQRQSDLEKLRNHTIRQQIEEIQNSIRQTNEEYVSIRTKSEQFSQLLSNSDLRREDILEKIDSLLKELDELKPRAQQLNHDVLLHETQMSEITGKLSSQNDLLSQKSAAFNEQNIFFHQQENRVKSIDQEIRFKQESMEQSSQRIELNLEELKKNEEEIKGIIESTHANDNELIAMYAEKEEMEKGLNEAEKDYYQTRGDIDQLEKDLREVQHARNTIDNLLMELQNQLNESKLQLNSVKERLSVEFNVDLDALTEQATPEESETLASLNEDKLRQEVSRIRERLDNMGPINPMAMEAYTEIKERNDFIIAQKEDLTKAKESLLSTITEIEGAASVTFMEAFNQIRDHFKRVFRSLFNEEDDCDLKLVDPNNPLESEIDIMAKPKGKRPLTINQLSGGEKTLTATALLFSMYLLKPAPFCIFDEVDAPLDDANIDKFNNIIRTFSKDSQFVIVTHNKRTMTSTDVIYGITMVEKGVSKVVPVDLRELA
jgi:chromosome segregation protein